MKVKKRNIFHLLKKRRSIVSFSSEMISHEDLMLLFDAARWAPSSRNAQPWRFIYATRESLEDYNRFFNLLHDGNKLWADTAPVLALSVAEVISDYKSKPNKYAFHDLGMAVGNLLTQATSMGIYVHQMGGYDVEGARKAFDIPERFEPGAMMAIGYPGEIDHLPMELKRRELQKRMRNEVDEFVFKARWKGKV